MANVTVTIGRANGPSLDNEVWLDFPEEHLDTVKDVLAMVNKVGHDREGWYLKLQDSELEITPIIRIRADPAPAKEIT